ncbi:MAG: penicillin acylase family protein [Pirellulales bacterium]|nr:penicillin acylase family protein [Pirellulales bacterium]
MGLVSACLVCLGLSTGQFACQAASHQRTTEKQTPVAGPTNSTQSSCGTHPDLAADKLAHAATIVRDEFGVAHISGPTLEAAVFGLAYAQAEDFFWQIEDSYILGLGRYAEVYGPSGLNSDLLNRAFEIVPKSRQAFASLDVEGQRLCVAYANGLNYFLRTHPHVKPRLIKHFEPWHVVAFGRQIVLETTFRYTRLHDSFVPRTNERIWSETGSNGWAIGRQRSRNNSTILFANPHQPWFGFGQMCEVHLRSEQEGLNFIGAGLYGSPLPTLGHNDRLGWTLTTNEPDIADVWRETFDHPDDPLAYRYAGKYRRAVEWTEAIRVKLGSKIREEKHTFRKTHHGPIVKREGERSFLSANVAGLHTVSRLRQLTHMMRAKDLVEFEEALDLNEFSLMNVIYADVDGNIGYYYTGTVPRRQKGPDWTKPVDGANPDLDWTRGLHHPQELPRLVNPPIGYVQNCNSSPFLTTSAENPLPRNFPTYMVEDAKDDRRRAMRSREILDERRDFDLALVAEMAFDTKMYWASRQLPRLREAFKSLEQNQPELAAKVRPYVEHLLDWDFRVTAESTQATLCEAWYFEIHESDYPGESLLPEYVNKPVEQINALGRVAAQLKDRYGSWKVPWKDVFRIQRVEPASDFWKLSFDDAKPSLPSLAVPGQLGAIFTQYYSPPTSFPISLVRKLDQRYGVVGTSYLGVWEFGPRESENAGVRGLSLVQFGSNGNLESPHAFDQAELLSQRKFKPEYFSWGDVVKASQASYHPADHATGRSSSMETPPIGPFP